MKIHSKGHFPNEMNLVSLGRTKSKNRTSSPHIMVWKVLPGGSSSPAPSAAQEHSAATSGACSPLASPRDSSMSQPAVTVASSTIFISLLPSLICASTLQWTLGHHKLLSHDLRNKKKALYDWSPPQKQSHAATVTMAMPTLELIISTSNHQKLVVVWNHILPSHVVLYCLWIFNNSEDCVQTPNEVLS